MRSLRSAASLRCWSSLALSRPAQRGDRARRLIANGEYLARAGDCIACHTSPAASCSPAAGRWPPRSARSLLPTSRPIPKPASACGPPTSSTGPCTLAASRDGGLIYPAMPFGSYTKVTREDCDAIFAYLRSVPPVHQPNRPHDLRFPFNNRHLILGWRTLFFQRRRIPARPGQIGRMEPRRLSRRGAGPLRDVPLADQRARRQLGIEGIRGRADPDAELVRALADFEQGGGARRMEHRGDRRSAAYGVSHRGAVYGPMAEVTYNSLQYLNDADVRAMAVYLKSLGQGARRARGLRRFPAAESSLLMSFGQTVYATHCASCHGDGGEGMPPDYPPLASNQSIQMESSVNPVRMVLNGGYPARHGQQPDALRHAALRAVPLRRRGRRRRDLYPRRLGQSRNAVSARQANELRAAPLD